ncbi:MAG: ribonuclease P protein component [bacterium]|nr:ribonuclease P protein component [bacterium]
MGTLKFTKQQRISTGAEFQAILKYGKKASDGYFRIAVILRPEQTRLKLGIIVSKKVGSAVERNRIKRVVREIVRLHQIQIVAGTNLVVIAKPDCVNKKYWEIEKSVVKLLDRVNGIKKMCELDTSSAESGRDQ